MIQGLMVWTVIEINLVGKLSLGRSRLGNYVSKDVKAIGAGVQWKETTENRDRRSSIYLEGWS